MRKHQRRNNYDTERASRKATRKAQSKPIVAVPYEPETLMALRLHTQLAYAAYQRKEYPLPSRYDFVVRVDGKLQPTDYARSRFAVLDG